MDNLKIYFLGFLLGAILILLSFRIIVFNESIYEKEILKNNINYEKEEITNLISYLKSGEELNFFNEKERMHLIDVKNLIDNTIYILYFLTAAFLIFIYRNYKYFSKISLISLLFILFIILLLYLSGFSSLFYKFHLLAFNNDLWILNPETDRLINIFPESFFFSMLKRVFYYSVWLASGTILISCMIKYKNNIKKKFIY